MTGASNLSRGVMRINRWTAYPKNISRLGDLLLTCKGTVGETAINAVGEIHIARQFMAIRGVTISTVEIAYLNLVLMASSKKLAQASTGLIPGIDRSAVLNLLVPIPPHNEQIRLTRTAKVLLQLLDFESWKN